MRSWGEFIAANFNPFNPAIKYKHIAVRGAADSVINGMLCVIPNGMYRFKYFSPSTSTKIFHSPLYVILALVPSDAVIITLVASYWLASSVIAPSISIRSSEAP